MEAWLTMAGMAGDSRARPGCRHSVAILAWPATLAAAVRSRDEFSALLAAWGGDDLKAEAHSRWLSLTSPGRGPECAPRTEVWSNANLLTPNPVVTPVPVLERFSCERCLYYLPTYLPGYIGT